MYRKNIVFIAFFCLLVIVVHGQGSFKPQKVVFPSPQSNQLGKYGGVTINHSSGQPNVNIPIYTVKEGDVSVPISLSYNYPGFKPADEPGWCGLGWTLNAGGVINRSMKGTADEIVSGQKTKIKTYVDGIDPVFTNYQQLNYYGLGNEYQETGPDIFSFQFDGYSGKFILDENGEPKIVSDQRIKFTPSKTAYGPENKQVITKWVAIGDNGTTYTFDAFEVSYQDANSIYLFPSAWYLTEIVNFKGDKITFEYTAKNEISSGKARIQSRIVDQLVTYVGSNSSQSNDFSLEIYLTKITTSLGTVNFISSEYSSMVFGSSTSWGRKLDNIQVKDLASNIIKQFNFSYGNPANYKLALNSVGEVGVPPHSFQYYQIEQIGNIVHGNTRQVDQWGFYNGFSNNLLIPDQPGVDLLPQTNLTKIGTLTSITYPTGGTTSFEYEQNQYSFVQNTLASGKITTVDNRNFSWRNISGAPLQQNSTPSIQITQPTRVDILFSASANCPATCDNFKNGLSSFITITLQPGNYSGDDLFKRPEFNDCNRVFGNCSPEQEPCPFIPPLGYEVGMTVKIFNVVPTSKPFYGGVRVSKITETPNGTGAIPIVTNYDYQGDSASISSGVISGEPIYDFQVAPYYPIYGIFQTEPIRFRRSASYNPVAMIPVYYKRVKESNTEFVTTRIFRSHSNVTDNEGKWATLYDYRSETIANEGFRTTNFLKLGDYQNYDFARGMPLSIEVKSQSGYLKRTTSYLYTDPYQTTFQTASLHHELLLNYTGSAGSSSGPQPFNVSLYYDKAYYILGGWPRKTSETTTTYGDNEASPVTVTSTFDYGSNHLQLIKQRTTQSDGGIEEANFKYPSDYPSGSTTLQSMVTANMLSYPVEQVSYYESASLARKVVDASVTTFKSYSGNSNKPTLLLPYKTFRYNGMNGSISTFAAYPGSSDETASGSYRETSKFTAYTKYGNPICVQLNGGDNLSYLWSYKAQYPVAEIKNADNATLLASMGGTSFDALADMTDSPTIKTKLDAVRTALPSALVTSYTYIPLVGVSIVTDPAGKSLYYDYDGLERLANIRNSAGGAIRNSYCYNYAGQMINCGTIAGTNAVTPPAVSLLSDGVACNYDISATITKSNPVMGEVITVSAVCSSTGGDCSGVTYSWAGMGLNSTTLASSTFSAPGVTGTFRYIVTSSKAGCTTQKDTVTATVIAGRATTIADGCYTIGTYGVLMQPQTNTAGATVQTSTPAGLSNQIFKIESVDTQTYKIISVPSGLVLNPNNNLAGQGVTVKIQAWANADYQKWYISPWTGYGLGGYQIANKSNTAFPIQNGGGSGSPGTAIDFSALGGWGHQRYTLTSVTCPTARVSAVDKDSDADAELPDPQILVFPNPVSDRLQIRTPGDQSIQKVEVQNSTGKSVLSITKIPVKGIDLRNLQSGIYLIKITFAGGETGSYKIIKE